MGRNEPAPHSVREPPRGPEAATPNLVPPDSATPDTAKRADRELLQRFIKDRDEAAFAELVRLHGPLVWGVCRRIVGHHHDAEEAFQATFLVLARKAATVRPPEMLANWLYGVACRTALKTRAAAARRRAKEVQTTVIPEPEVSPAECWEEIAPLLDRELRRLPDKYRAAVISCDLEGRSRQEAALQLGCPEGTLKTRLTRGRSILATRLARQGVVLSVGALTAIVSQNAASAAVPPALAASTAKAGALAATKAASTAAFGTKAAVFAKAAAKPAILVKAAVGATLVVSVLFLASEKIAEHAAGLTLPAEVRKALQENAEQLSPISATFTLRQEHLSAKAALARAAQEYQCKVIWQDGKLYVARRIPIGMPGAGADNRTLLNEFTYNGRVFSSGNAVSSSSDTANALTMQAGTLGPQKVPRAFGHRGLTKEPVAKALRMPGGIESVDLYLRLDVAGFVIGAAPSAPSPGGDTGKQNLVAASAVLDLLDRGAKLISIENVPIDGKPCLRVDLDAENPVRRAARAIDLDQYRKKLKGSGISANAQQSQIDRVERQRNLPASRHYIYYLDPSLHYAVRRLEERYKGETLLARIDCSQFERIPGRPLWLPNRVATEIYDSDERETAPAGGASWSKNINVSELDGRRVPEDTFALDNKFNEPGTIVRDETDPAAATLPRGAVQYVIPARVEDLPDVIERARKGESIGRRASAAALPSAVLTELPPTNYRNDALVTIILCNLLVLGAVAAYLVWRRRKRDSV